jgi:hypothetical protein
MKELRPSSALCNYNIGDIFTFEDGKRYILLKRDSVKCIVERWTFWDAFLDKLLYSGGNNKHGRGKQS